MAFTTPKTWGPGAVTSADLNTYLSGLITELQNFVNGTTITADPGITWNTGFALTSGGLWLQKAVGIITASIRMTYSGSTITAPTSGALTNVPMFTMPAAWSMTSALSNTIAPPCLTNATDDQMAWNVQIDGSGAFKLASCPTPGRTITSGADLRIYVQYPAAS